MHPCATRRPLPSARRHRSRVPAPPQQATLAPAPPDATASLPPTPAPSRPAAPVQRPAAPSPQSIPRPTSQLIIKIKRAVIPSEAKDLTRQPRRESVRHHAHVRAQHRCAPSPHDQKCLPQTRSFFPSLPTFNSRPSTSSIVISLLRYLITSLLRLSP